MSFTVTAFEFSATAARVAKLNARAAKAGIAAVATLTEIAREIKTETTEFGFDRTYEVVEAEISGVEHVVLGDWTLAAVVDHDEAGNILRSVPGFPVQIPALFHETSASRCDHCNAVRNRSNTILVWNETEGFKQVGSDCVKLFLGVSVSSLIAWFEGLDSIPNDEGGSWGSREISTSEFVAAAAFVTEVYGFKPASFEGQATKRIASDLIRLTGQALSSFKNTHPELFADNALAVARANVLTAAAIAWIAETDSNGNEYLLNLKIAARRDAAGDNTGLLASLPNAYKRAAAGEAQRAAKAAEKAAQPASEFLGTEGTKVTVKATPVYTNRSEGYSYYSPDSLFVILVAEGGEVIYLNTTVETTVGVTLENAVRGTVFTVTGTVKSHKLNDKGEKITVLTRCKAQ